MEGLYYFGEYQRWNFFFVNPNVAGAFVAMLIAFIIPFTGILPCKKNKNIRILFLAFLCLELTLYFLLAKTYSRGALVALVVSLVLFALLALTARFKWKSIVAILSVKFCVLAMILFFTGFIGRVSPQFLSQDGSVGARTQLWGGGLRLIAANPANGWGIDNSGSAYMNWMQEFDDDRRYQGMVNSYMHVSIERGLPVLLLVLAALLAPAIYGASVYISPHVRFLNTVVCACSICIVAFLVCNIFSTLWVFPELWWLLSLIHI